MNRRVFFVLACLVCFGSALVGRSLNARAEGCSGRDDCGGGDGSGGKGGPTGTSHCGATGEICCTGQGQEQCRSDDGGPQNVCGGNNRCDYIYKQRVVCNNPARTVFLLIEGDDYNEMCRSVGATPFKHTVCNTDCVTYWNYAWSIDFGWYN